MSTSWSKVAGGLTTLMASLGRGALAGLLVAASWRGQSPAVVHLEHPDGRMSVGQLLEWGADGRLSLEMAGTRTHFPLSEVASVSFSQPRVARPSNGALLVFHGGDRLWGTLDDGNFDEVAITTLGLGSLRVLIDHLAVVQFSGPDGGVVPLPGEASDEDELFLGTKTRVDRLPGELLKVVRGAVVFTSAAGNERRFGTVSDQVLAVRLAKSDRTPPAAVGVVCSFRDGSRASGTIVAKPDGGLAFQLAVGGEATLDRNTLSAIEFRASGVTALGDLTPLRYQHEPFFPEAQPAMWLCDDALPVRPTAPGTRPWRRGLGLPLGAKITYAIPNGATRFTTEIRLPEARGAALGRARLCIFADGHSVSESETIAAGGIGLPVQVALPAGARELELYAEGLDIVGSGGRLLLASASFR